MARVKERHLEAKYRRFFGRIAGHLPRDRAAVDEDAKTLRKEGLDNRQTRRRTAAEWESPGIADFPRLIQDDGIVRMSVAEMIRQQARGHASVHDAEEM